MKWKSDNHHVNSPIAILCAKCATMLCSNRFLCAVIEIQVECAFQVWMSPTLLNWGRRL